MPPVPKNSPTFKGPYFERPRFFFTNSDGITYPVAKAITERGELTVDPGKVIIVNAEGPHGEFSMIRSYGLLHWSH